MDLWECALTKGSRNIMLNYHFQMAAAADGRFDFSKVVVFDPAVQRASFPNPNEENLRLTWWST